VKPPKIDGVDTPFINPTIIFKYTQRLTFSRVDLPGHGRGCSCGSPSGEAVFGSLFRGWMGWAKTK